MKLLLIALLTIILVSSSILTHELYAKSKAEKSITKAIGRAVEGNWKSIDMVNISKINDNSTLTVWNKTVVIVPPTPPNPPPNPPPTPVGNVSKVCLVGDLSGSTVPNLMKSCPYKIGLGDLGYQSTLSYFKGLNFNKCLEGNHEAANEDGSASLEKETQLYCGDSWTIKVGQATQIFGFNTNGNLDNQLAAAKQVSMSGIKTVIILSHKPCYTSPNSHHPVESKVKAFCDSLAKAIPAGIKIIYIAAHNHQQASTVDGTKFISGAGGRSHYSCGTDNLWNYCNNKSYGYLELTIDNENGNTAAKFVN